MSSSRTAHIRIEGLVQGVGYRAWIEHQAVAMGLGGWVRNRRDGSVEAVFQGGSEIVADILARCEQGPPGARVTGVEMLGADAGTYDGFEVRQTA